MSWHQHTWNILSVWKCFVAIFGRLILKNDDAHCCHQFLAAEDQKTTFVHSVLISNLPYHLQLSPYWVTSVFFFFYKISTRMHNPNLCSQPSWRGIPSSDSNQMKSPPSGCLVWNSPFIILWKWFYCLSFWLLREITALIKRFALWSLTAFLC